MKSIYRELGMTNILLVENDPWTRDSLSLFFRFEGCRLKSAANAEEALAALSTDRFDLILCEHRPPDIDGLSLLRQYGNRQPKAVKFLIAVHPPDRTAEEIELAGIHDVIRKPFTVEKLEHSLRRLFGRAGGAGDPVLAR